MANDAGELFAIVRAIAAELLRRWKEWLAERPQVQTTLVVAAMAFALILVARLVMGVLWAPAGIPLGRVSGTVTLDGRPLRRATVEYTPEDGAPAYGLTDSSGAYALSYVPGRLGAVLGEQTVRITTYDWVTQRDGSKQEVPELVPARYNADSVLSTTVERGSQRHDWKLRSQ